MYCSKCGMNQPNDTAFCTNCGAKLNKDAVCSFVGTFNASESYSANARLKLLSTHPVLNAFKNFFSSPLALTAAIAYTAASVLILINSLTGNQIAALFSALFSSLGMTAYYSYMYTDFFYAVIVVSMLCAVFDFILKAVFFSGMWITYASAAEGRTGTMKTCGFTMMSVVCIIRMVLAAVLTVISELLLIVVLSGVSDMDAFGYYGGYDLSPDTLALFIIILGAVIFAAAALYILYGICTVSTLNKFKYGINTGRIRYKSSVLVAVVNFIGAAYSIAMIFGNNGVVSTLALLTGAVAYVTIGILLISYRSKMQNLFYSINANSGNFCTASVDEAVRTSEAVVEKTLVNGCVYNDAQNMDIENTDSHEEESAHDR